MCTYNSDLKKNNAVESAAAESTAAGPATAASTAAETVCTASKNQSSMTFRIVAVTNRALYEGDFLEKVREIAAAHPDILILREKDLDEKSYEKLAADVLDICRYEGTECILHTYPEAASRLGCRKIHLPLHILRTYAGMAAKRPQEDSRTKAFRLSDFDVTGASVHSLNEGIEARKLGAAYVTAGHVFVTDCKKGMEPRGLGFLSEIAHTLDIPVYAIGGINAGNIAETAAAGASGACIMSGFMQCSDAEAYVKQLRNAVNAVLLAGNRNLL